MVEQSKPTDIKATSATKPEVEEKSAPESGIEKKVQSETSSTGADRPNSNATTAVNKPEVGLVSQEGLPEGGVRLEYNPDQRPDRLKEATKRSIQGGEELTKKFDGRSDGLEAERVLVKGSVTEQEVKYEQGKGRDGLLSETKVTKDGSVKFEMRTFDPAKNPQHQSCETVTRDGSITTTARAFEGRKDGLKLETVTEDGPGLRRTRQFADGSVEVSRKGEDGLWRGTRTRAGVTLSTLELPNGATMLQSDKGIEIRTANGKSTYSLEKQPGGVKLTIDGNSWSSTDGKTFKNGTESFEATLLPNGDLRRNFKDRVPPESEIRRTDGSILVVDSQDKLLSATSKDGVTFKLDAQQRIIQSQKGDVTTNFQYDGQSQTPSSFTVGERKFEIVKAGDKSAFVVTTKGDGSETLPQIDDTLHPAFKGATVRVEGEDGRLNAVVRPNGDRIQYGYTLDAKQHAMGRADQPSQITKYSNEQVEKWVTADGVKWEQLNADGSKNGNTWEGIKTLDQKTGQMTETAMVRKDGALKTVTTATKIDGTINADVRPSADQEAGKPAVERSVNLDVRLKEIKQAADPSQWFSTEKADVIRRQLKDLSPEEIQLLKRAYDPSNPNAFGDFLKQQFERLPEGPYGLPPGGIEGNAHRWAEVEGQLKRNGQPGEETAIQLKVDALEARYAGFYGNRSIEAIQQNTRLALLGTTEEQRTQVESALGRLYENNGLSKFYQSGDGANLTRGDAFTKSVIDLTSRKGVDARTPSEQSDLLKVALRTQDIKKFREVSAKEAMTADGRKYFAENGGINAIDEKRASGRALAYVFGPEIRAELKELARFGEESPLTQFKKGIGIFSNVDSALQDAVKRTANNPEWRARYLDGRELARSGATPQTEEQKQALDYYKEWQKVFQSAHIFGADRSATNYEAQIVSPDGALASGQLFQQGGEWFQNASDLFKVVEGASNEQLNVLLNGARVNAGTDGTATAQSDGLTDAIKALDLSINNGTNRERLDKLIADKVKYAVELSQLTDKIADSPPNQPVDENAIAQFKKMVPAFKDVPADKMQSILQGYRLDRALREGRLNPDSISDADRQSILAFRKLGEDRKANPTESKLHDFLKGRESQRHIDKIMQDNSLSAGTKDRQVSDYLKSMGDLDRLSLDSFRQQRNDAIQSNVRRDLKDAIADAKDQQALVAAVKNATVQEQERFRNDPQYQQEIRDLVKRYTYNPTSRKATGMLFDQFVNQKPMSKSDALIFGTLERLANENQAPSEKRKILITTIRDALKEDKDGSLAKELLTNEKVRKELSPLIGGERKFDQLVIPAIEYGIASYEQLSFRYSQGKEMLKETILEANSKGLKYLASPEGKAQKDAMLKGMSDEQRALAEKVIRQGEVKPEDRFRAFLIGVEKEDATIDLLKNMKPAERARAIQGYHDSFGKNLHEEMRDKVGSTNKPFVELLAHENNLTGEEALIKSRELVTNSTTTWLGQQGLKYDSTTYAKLSDLALTVRDLTPGSEASSEVLDQKIKALAERLKSFDGTKDEIATLVVEGLITAGAVLASPFTGGTSLALLTLAARFGTMTAIGGLSGAFLKAHLTGNYDHLAGDLLKYSMLTGANLLGGEFLMNISGFGSRVATKTIEQALADKAFMAVAKGTTPALRDNLMKGLVNLIEHGALAGGIKDDAIVTLVSKTATGLTLEAQNALAQAIIANLGQGIKAVATDGLKSSLITAARGARTAGLDGTAGFIGGFTGDATGQLVDKGEVDLSRAALSGIANFVFAGTVRAGVEAARVHMPNAKPHENERVEGPSKDKVEPVQRDPQAHGDGTVKIETPQRPIELPDARVDELPPGSVEKVNERVQQMLTERQKIVDVTKLDNIRAEISNAHQEWSQTAVQAMVHNHQRVPNFSEVTPEYLNSLPDGELKTQLNRIYKNRESLLNAEREIQNEFDLRCAELTKIINEEARNVYPNGVFAKFTVVRAEKDGNRLGFFSNNEFIGISDSMLVPNLSTVGTLLHEVKHGEQHGLLIRKFIDEVAPEANSKRPLTEEETKRVIELAKERINSDLTPDIVAQIAERRAGQRLSAPELERANALQKSFQEKNAFNAERQQLKDQRAAVERWLDDFEFDLTMPDDEAFFQALSVKKFLDHGVNGDGELEKIFGGRIPDEVAKLVKQQADFKLVGEQLPPEEFARNVHKQLVDLLRTEKDKVLRDSERHYQIYRNWLHETEAHSIGEEIKARTGTFNPYELDVAADNLLKKLFASSNPEHSSNADNVPYAQHFLDQSRQTGHFETAEAMRVAADLMIDEPASLTTMEVRLKIKQTLLEFAENTKDDPAMQKAYREVAEMVANVNVANNSSNIIDLTPDQYTIINNGTIK